jgi:FKBP-type peptidyl-prolyl cis-trans isomerase
MTGGNSEAVPYRKRKNEDKTAEEAKRVKHTLEQPAASASSAAGASSSSSSASASTQASQAAPKKKSLLGRLLTEKVDAGKGYGLFD